jgi:hypothetical protein
MFAGMSSSAPLAAKLQMRAYDEYRAEREKRRALEAKRRAKIDRWGDLMAKGRRKEPPPAQAPVAPPESIPNGPAHAIQIEVAKRYGVTITALKSESRNVELFWIRAEAMYLIARDTLVSTPRISKMFGRHHTSALHAIRRYAERNKLPPARAPQQRGDETC